MKKEEFLKKLRKELDILEESEINDIIEEYEGYIDEKINQGCTEQEAIKSMGDIDELASELLSAYKIKKPQEKASFNNLVSSVINIFNQIVEVLATKSFSEILKFILEMVIIFLIIGIFKIPFIIIEDIIENTFRNAGYLGFIFKSLSTFAIELIYLVFAFILFIKIFEKRYLKNKSDEPLEIKKKSSSKQSPEKNLVSKPTVPHFTAKPSKSLIDVLANLCLIFIKFMVFWFLLGNAFYISIMAIILGICLYLLFKGVTYFGIYLALLALFNFGIISFIFLYNFIFNNRNKPNFFLITIIINFILLGLGAGLGSLEIANTSFTYENTIVNPQTEEVFLDMQDNLILPYNLTNNLIVDDSLGDKVKIEYVYSQDIIHLDTNTYTAKNGNYRIVICSYDIEKFNYNPEYLNRFLNDLKTKNIHSYELVQIKVYASTSNAEKLENNRFNYDYM